MNVFINVFILSTDMTAVLFVSYDFNVITGSPFKCTPPICKKRTTLISYISLHCLKHLCDMHSPSFHQTLLCHAYSIFPSNTFYQTLLWHAYSIFPSNTIVTCILQHCINPDFKLLNNTRRSSSRDLNSIWPFLSFTLPHSLGVSVVRSPAILGETMRELFVQRNIAITKK